MHNIVNVLNGTELLTLKRLMCYVNFTSEKEGAKEEEREKERRERSSRVGNNKKGENSNLFCRLEIRYVSGTDLTD